MSRIHFCGRAGVLLTALAVLSALLVLPAAAQELFEENDAGSGSDAGHTAETAVPIERGRAYDATLVPKASSLLLLAADEDAFAFHADAGEEVTATILGQSPEHAPNCITIHGADFTEIDTTCAEELTITTTAAGIHYVVFGYFAVAPTSYRFGINATQAPPPTPTLYDDQDDAGSGGDAGPDRFSAVPVERGVEYDATLGPVLVDPVNATFEEQFEMAGDRDTYAFTATAGESIVVSALRQDVDLTPNCITVHDEEDVEVARSGCGNTAHFIAPADGTYYAQFGYVVLVPTNYSFAINSLTPAHEAYATGGRDMRPDPDQPTVIVAVADTGVNPYHDAYRRPHLTVHPCEWVAGFDDCSIPALELSIGEYDTYEEAYAADLAIWRSLEIGQWYWIPGTNIIGAVCDGTTNVNGTPPRVSADAPCIHDEHGHGTGTTSSVLSEAPNALLLVHEGNSGASALATAPVVPDIQSHSWGPAAPLPLHVGDPVIGHLGATLADTGAEDPATLFFIAAGNEGAFPTLVDYSRVHPSVQVVGGGFPGRATGGSWTVFDYASWYCRPTAVPDSSTAVRDSFCGTSFSAPTVAGTAAAALLALRQEEGYLGRSTPDQVAPSVTREAFVHALRSAATYAPEARYPNTGSGFGWEVDMPAGTEPFFWGYGFLDATDVDAIVACAAEGECPEKSAEAQAWNDLRHKVRRAQTDPVGPGLLEALALARAL